MKPLDTSGVANGGSKPPTPQSKYKPSWNLPLPLVFTASDPNACDGHSNVADVARIVAGGEAPVWLTEHGGTILQTESQPQLEWALNYVRRHPYLLKDPIALVHIDGIDPTEALELGITTSFIECYLQGQANAWDKIGQAYRDGWPFPIPVVGAFDAIGLGSYRPTLDHYWPNAAVYLGEGMNDTNSWSIFGQLCAL